MRKPATYAALGAAVVLGGLWAAGALAAAVERNQAADAARAAAVSRQQADEVLAAVVTSADAAAGSGSFEDAKAFADAAVRYYRDADSAAVARAFGSASDEFWEAARTAADAADAYEDHAGSGDAHANTSRAQEEHDEARQARDEFSESVRQMTMIRVVLRRRIDGTELLGTYEAVDSRTGRLVIVHVVGEGVMMGTPVQAFAKYEGQQPYPVTRQTAYGAVEVQESLPVYFVNQSIERRAQAAEIDARLEAAAVALNAAQAAEASEAQYRAALVEAILPAADKIRALGA